MCVKAITCYLNERRIFTRDGGRWELVSIHQILPRTTYIGEHRFNERSHKNWESKPENEVAGHGLPADDRQ
jgi:site-specific DNA recombinase